MTGEKQRHVIARSLRVWCILLVAAAASGDDVVSYDGDILPIFRAECIACHNEDDAEGDLNLASYDGLMTGGASGPVVDPGDPDESLLYRLVAHLDQPSMPPETPMIAPESVAAIKQWIASGAPQSAGEGGADVIDTAAGGAVPAPISPGTEDGSLPPRLPKRPAYRGANRPAALSLAASPTAPLVAVAGVRQVWFHRVDTLESLGSIPFSGDVRDMAFSNDGSLLLIGGGNPGARGWVELWDVAGGKKIMSIGEGLDEVRACAISSDHKRVALAAAGSKILLYDLASGKQVAKLEGHNDWVTALKFSDDAVLLASADRQGGLFLWNGWTGELYEQLKGHKQPIHSLSWSKDSNSLSSSGDDGFVRIWSADGGQEEKKIKAHPEGVVAHETFGDGWVTSGRDNLVRIWNAEGKSIRAHTPYAARATSLAISRPGGGMIAGDYSGRVVVLDTDTGAVRGEIELNPTSVEERITDKRALQAQLLEQRKEIEVKRNEVIGQLKRMNHKRAEWAEELEQVNRRIVSAQETVLDLKRKVRRFTAEVGTANSQQSRVLIKRKLARMALRHEEEVLDEQNRRHDDLNSLYDELLVKKKQREVVLQQAEALLSKNKQEAKRVLIQLAALVEESAFSIAYEALREGE